MNAGAFPMTISYLKPPGSGGGRRGKTDPGGTTIIDQKLLIIDSIDSNLISSMDSGDQNDNFYITEHIFLLP
jgi:hypothetical protein